MSFFIVPLLVTSVSPFADGPEWRQRSVIVPLHLANLQKPSDVPKGLCAVCFGKLPVDKNGNLDRAKVAVCGPFGMHNSCHKEWRKCKDRQHYRKMGKEVPSDLKPGGFLGKLVGKIPKRDVCSKSKELNRARGWIHCTGQRQRIGADPSYASRSAKTPGPRCPVCLKGIEVLEDGSYDPFKVKYCSTNRTPMHNTCASKWMTCRAAEVILKEEGLPKGKPCTKSAKFHKRGDGISCKAGNAAALIKWYAEDAHKESRALKRIIAAARRKKKNSEDNK